MDILPGRDRVGYAHLFFAIVVIACLTVTQCGITKGLAWMIFYLNATIRVMTINDRVRFPGLSMDRVRIAYRLKRGLNFTFLCPDGWHL